MEKKYGVSLKWLSVTSFELRFNGLSVVTDPYITECAGTDLNWEAVENCDIICLSHPHWDHISDIPRLMEKFHPILLCGELAAGPMARWLNWNPTEIYPMNPDVELDFDSVKIRALFARHTRRKNGYRDICDQIAARESSIACPALGELQSLGSLEYRNYLFTLPNGTKLLIWGSDPTVEQINLCKALKPDIAIVQRSVGREANAKKAAFAAAIGCKVLIPHHQDVYGADDPQILQNFGEDFLSLVPDGTFIIPEHGKWMEL